MLYTKNILLATLLAFPLQCYANAQLEEQVKSRDESLEEAPKNIISNNFTTDILFSEPVNILFSTGIDDVTNLDARDIYIISTFIQIVDRERTEENMEKIDLASLSSSIDQSWKMSKEAIINLAKYVKTAEVFAVQQNIIGSSAKTRVQEIVNKYIKRMEILFGNNALGLIGLDPEKLQKHIYSLLVFNEVQRLMSSVAESGTKTMTMEQTANKAKELITKDEADYKVLVNTFTFESDDKALVENASSAKSINESRNIVTKSSNSKEVKAIISLEKNASQLSKEIKNAIETAEENSIIAIKLNEDTNKWVMLELKERTSIPGLSFNEAIKRIVASNQKEKIETVSNSISKSFKIPGILLVEQ